MLPARRTASLLFACALSSAAAIAQVSFQSHTVTPAQLDPVNTTMHADFNGDGREDLVIVTSAGSSLLLSSGDGTYRSPVALPAPVDAVGDFNQDGKLDFISYHRNGAGASNESTAATVYLGNGDGTFQNGKPVAGSGPSATNDTFFLIVADLNHDGKTDFATVDETTGTGSNGFATFAEVVQVWLSNGSGGFTRGQSFTTKEPDPLIRMSGLAPFTPAISTGTANPTSPSTITPSVRRTSFRSGTEMAPATLPLQPTANPMLMLP